MRLWVRQKFLQDASVTMIQNFLLIRKDDLIYSVTLPH